MDNVDNGPIEDGQESFGTERLLSSSFREFNLDRNEVQIRMDERERLARELHDSTSQLIVALELQLIRLKQIMKAPRADVFEHLLAELGASVTGLHREIRALGDSWHDPGTLDRDLTVMAAEFGVRSGVALRTDITSLPARTSPQVAHVIYRVAQEALANVSRHAHASNAFLSLTADQDSITLRIADDGIGFSRSLGKPSEGCGIRNMTDRLREVGGKLTIEDAEGGASVVAKIDC
jgi:two-component system NarL family sensor kinase